MPPSASQSCGCRSSFIGSESPPAPLPLMKVANHNSLLAQLNAIIFVKFRPFKQNISPTLYTPNQPVHILIQIPFPKCVRRPLKICYFSPQVLRPTAIRVVLKILAPTILGSISYLYSSSALLRFRTEKSPRTLVFFASCVCLKYSAHCRLGLLVSQNEDDKIFASFSRPA